MPADIPKLLQALDGLEQRMRDQNSPVGRHLRPGLTDGEIDTLTAGLPFRVSDELRAFYSWHDGVFELDRPEWPYFPGGAVLRPLHLAIEDYAGWVEVPVVEGWEEYRPGWFPINSLDGIALIVDCSVGPGEASPIHYVDVKADWQQDCAPSLLHAVNVWNQMIDDGYWTYDTETGDWDKHYSEIPIEIRLSNLVG